MGETAHYSGEGGQLAGTWAIHSRIVLYLLEAVAESALGASPPKGRTPGEMFAHIHNVRLMWLKVAAPDLMSGLDKVEKAEADRKDALRSALEGSGRATGTLIEQSEASGGKIKGFKPHAAAFLGYMIAHESYHHGELGVALAQVGQPLDKKAAYGMWEWGSR